MTFPRPIRLVNVAFVLALPLLSCCASDAANDRRAVSTPSPYSEAAYQWLTSSLPEALDCSLCRPTGRTCQRSTVASSPWPTSTRAIVGEPQFRKWKRTGGCLNAIEGDQCVEYQADIEYRAQVYAAFPRELLPAGTVTLLTSANAGENQTSGIDLLPNRYYLVYSTLGADAHGRRAKFTMRVSFACELPPDLVKAIVSDH